MDRRLGMKKAKPTTSKEDAENKKILEYSITKSNLLPSCVGSPST
jgi:hypothetical protein